MKHSILLLDQFDLFGGAQLYILDMMSMLQGPEFNFHVNQVDDSTCQQRLESMGLSQLPLYPFFSRRRGISSMPSALRHMLRLKRLFPSPDLVLSNSLPGLLSGKVAYGSNRPRLHIAHRIDLSLTQVRLLKACRPDLLLTVSEDARCYFESHGFSRENLGVVPNGFSLEEWPVEHRPTSGPLCIGLVGRMAREKGVLDLIEIARRMSGKRNIIFKIFGEADEAGFEKEVRMQIANKDLTECITLCGRQASGPNLYRDIGLLLNLTNTRESFGRSFAEAALCGVPTIGYRNGGPEDWIEHGISGWFAQDLDDLVNQLESLLTDPKEIARVGKEARARILANYSLERSSQQLSQIFRDRIRGTHG